MGPCNSTDIKANKPIRIRIQNARKNFNPSQSEYLLSDELATKGRITKKYKLSTEYLGRGASGVVSEATDKKGKKYAVKCVNKLVLKNVTNITSEVEISLLLDHPHIIKCFEVYEDMKTISFVMELIEGGDLLDYITGSPLNHLTDEESLDIIIQILETLKYLHIDNKIVHRDLKPENFLVLEGRKKGFVKLIDFGFATYIPEDDQLKDDLGSPIYTAPEILRKQPYNEKVDIWSAGVILFNMVTGYQPFFSEKEDEIDKVVLSKQINFSVIQNENLKQLCMHMLEKDPKKRFDVLQALDFARKVEKGATTEVGEENLNGSGSRRKSLLNLDDNRQ